MYDATLGPGGFLVTYYAFIEYINAENNWKKWAHDNAIDREHALFLSAMTYGVFQFTNRQETLDIADPIKQKFQQFQKSPWSARIMAADARTFDIAAENYAYIVKNTTLTVDGNVTPFVEVATAAQWNLALVITNREDDVLKKIVEHLEGFRSSTIECF